MPRDARSHPVSPHTHTRRTVLEWLGQGAAVAALPPALSACFPTKPEDSCCGRHDSERHDSEPGDSEPTPHDPDCPAGTFDFAPSEAGDSWEGFTVFTVDPQDLDALLAGWALTVDGLVKTPRTYTFADLVALTRQDQVTDFHCVTGWSVHDVPWNGVHLATLLAGLGPAAGATHVTFHTVDGIYNESLPLEVALEPRSMLAYGVCGATLPLDHGFPLRLVVPRLLGYKNAKYVQRIELTDHAVEGFWVQRGYSYEGEVPPDRLRGGRY